MRFADGLLKAYLELNMIGTILLHLVILIYVPRTRIYNQALPPANGAMALYSSP